MGEQCSSEESLESMENRRQSSPLPSFSSSLRRDQGATPKLKAMFISRMLKDKEEEEGPKDLSIAYSPQAVVSPRSTCSPTSVSSPRSVCSPLSTVCSLPHVVSPGSVYSLPNLASPINIGSPGSVLSLSNVNSPRSPVICKPMPPLEPIDCSISNKEELLESPPSPPASFHPPKKRQKVHLQQHGKQMVPFEGRDLSILPDSPQSLKAELPSLTSPSPTTISGQLSAYPSSPSSISSPDSHLPSAFSRVSSATASPCAPSLDDFSHSTAVSSLTRKNSRRSPEAVNGLKLGNYDIPWGMIHSDSQRYINLESLKQESEFVTPNRVPPGRCVKPELLKQESEISSPNQVQMHNQLQHNHQQQSSKILFGNSLGVCSTAGQVQQVNKYHHSQASLHPAAQGVRKSEGGSVMTSSVHPRHSLNSQSPRSPHNPAGGQHRSVPYPPSHHRGHIPPGVQRAAYHGGHNHHQLPNHTRSVIRHSNGHHQGRGIAHQSLGQTRLDQNWEDAHQDSNYSRKEKQSIYSSNSDYEQALLMSGRHQHLSGSHNQTLSGGSTVIVTSSGAYAVNNDNLGLATSLTKIKEITSNTKVINTTSETFWLNDLSSTAGQEHRTTSILPSQHHHKPYYSLPPPLVPAPGSQNRRMPSEMSPYGYSNFTQDVSSSSHKPSAMTKNIPVDLNQQNSDVEEYRNKPIAKWIYQDVVDFMFTAWEELKCENLDINFAELSGSTGQTLLRLDENGFKQFSKCYGDRIYRYFLSYKAMEERKQAEVEALHQQQLLACSQMYSTPYELNGDHGAAGAYGPQHLGGLRDFRDTAAPYEIQVDHRVFDGTDNITARDLSNHLPTAVNKSLPPLNMSPGLPNGTSQRVPDIGSSTTEENPKPEPPKKRGPGRPRKPENELKKKKKKTGRLWEFIRNLLLDPETCPSMVRWENAEEGMFRFVQAEKVAQRWGDRKQNKDMNYEKLSRAMRYYYKTHIFEAVLGRRLVYKFGKNAKNWRPANPNFPDLQPREDPM